MLSAIYACCIYIQVHFRLYFIMEANTMNPDQTAPFGVIRSGSDLSHIKAAEKGL